MSGASPRPGWHLAEWTCELVGTAFLILVGFSAGCVDFGAGSPVPRAIPSTSVRLLLTGIIFAGSGSLVAVTPVGRRSGAHLNPAVTLAFWCRRHVHLHDLAGYVVAQCVGAIAACALVWAMWGRWATSIHLDATLPGRGLGDVQAAAVEAGMTALVVGTIFFMVSSPGRARWTPLVLWPLIAIEVWQGAPYTGTSLNPARSLAPAMVGWQWDHLPDYLLGPLVGAAVAVAVFALVPRAETLTAKLYHDTRYPSTLGSRLPVPVT